MHQENREKPAILKAKLRFATETSLAYLCNLSDAIDFRRRPQRGEKLNTCAANASTLDVVGAWRTNLFPGISVQR
jgi:hypothetical protein